MEGLELRRRAVLLGIGGLSIRQILPEGNAQDEVETPAQGLVLDAGEGEHLVHFRDHGNIFIKLSSDASHGRLALGTQQVMAGSGIPVHRHFQMEEAFYVLDGGGRFLLDDKPHSVEKGSTIFIPRNTWHGFENPGRELLLLWIVAPAGLDGFFREVCSPPGTPAKQRSKAEINEIARRYGTEFR